ncbi:hypothetical protein BB558_000386 [Smittium angustum]|uniref:Dymeclin n=1 Tax=Smittium angustum TaxID=133377 RepID=A0A2U1JE99_SMIAN|nr:hypothetical protein BB558_000386 [Smittium angustum]
MERKYKLIAPKHWDKKTSEYLIKIVSITPIPLDNTSFWIKESANLVTFQQETEEQETESFQFIKQLGYQQSAIEVSTSSQLSQLLEDKKLHMNSVLNLSKKFNSNEDGQVFIHALQQVSEAYTYWVWGENSQSSYNPEKLRLLSSSLLITLISQPGIRKNHLQNEEMFSNKSQESEYEPHDSSEITSKNIKHDSKEIDPKRTSSFTNINTTNSLKIQKSESFLEACNENPYFSALSNLCDAKRRIENNMVSFTELLDFLSGNLEKDENVFILSFMINTNKNFREYCIARTDPEVLVLKTLECINKDFSVIQPTSLTSHQKSLFSHIDTPLSPSASSKKQSSRIFDNYSEPAHQNNSPITNIAYPVSPSASAAFHPQIPADSSYFRSGSISENNSINLDMLPISKIKLLTPRIYSLLGILANLASDEHFVEGLKKSVRSNHFTITVVDYISWTGSGSWSKGLKKWVLVNVFIGEILELFLRNFSSYKDPTIHTYTLLCLFNVLPKTSDIPHSLANRIIKVYEMVTKHFSKLIVNFKEDTPREQIYRDIQNLTISENTEIMVTTSNFSNRLRKKSISENSQRNRPRKSSLAGRKDFRELYKNTDPDLAIASVVGGCENYNELEAYADTHYMLSLIIFKTVFYEPSKNIDLVYEMVRTKDIVLAPINSNLTSNANLIFEKYGIPESELRN